MSHQLTIRYGDDLARQIADLARQEGLSRNQAVLRLLRKGAGITEEKERRDVIGSSLDWFAGSWTEEEAREFDEAVADFETIDEELWT
jgi:hypothetical protein